MTPFCKGQRNLMKATLVEKTPYCTLPLLISPYLFLAWEKNSNGYCNGMITYFVLEDKICLYLVYSKVMIAQGCKI